MAWAMYSFGITNCYMNTLKKIILFFLYTLPLLAYSQDSLKTHYNLEECIDLALKHNAEAQKSANSSALASLDLKQAKAALLPTLGSQLDHNVSTGFTTDPVTNANISVNTTFGSQSLNTNILLFNGLNLLRTIRQQAFAYKATQMDEQRIKDNLTLDIILAYLQVITTQDVLDQNKQQRDVTSKQLDRLALLNKDGAISPNEYYDVKGQFSGDQVKVLTAENTLRTNKIALTRLLNIPYKEELSFEPINQLPDINSGSLTNQTLYENAVTSLGALKAAKFWKESADYELKATRSLYFPSLSFGAGLNSRYSSNTIGKGTYMDQVRDNLGKGAVLTLSIPILDGFRRRINVSRAKIAVRNAEIDLENTENSLQQQTAQVLINLETAKEKYLELKNQVEAYKESFRVAEVQFEAGAINSVEFLLQKNKYDQSSIDLVVAQYEWQLRQRIASYYNGAR